MADMYGILTDRFADLAGIEYFTFAFNIFVYFFSNSIVSHHRDIDEDTIYFIINTLNQLNADLIRNNLLLKVLPLKV